MLIQGCLLLGWIVAPTADALTYHRASADRSQPEHLPALEAPPAHSLGNCSIVKAATRPLTTAASNVGLVVFHAEIPEPAPLEPSPALSTCSVVLPPSRAPPSR